MAQGEQATHSQKVEVNVEAKGRGKAEEESYPQVPARFLPKEGYELIGSLVKTDPILAKTLFKLLKGKEIVADEDSPSGYKEKQIPGAHAFCNGDGVEKITDFLILHINTPLSYKERGFTASQAAKQISKQFEKDIAANFKRWEVENPSLIPQLVAVVYQFVRAAQGQHGELTEDLLSGGALRPKAPESPAGQKKPKVVL